MKVVTFKLEAAVSDSILKVNDLFKRLVALNEERKKFLNFTTEAQVAALEKLIKAIDRTTEKLKAARKDLANLESQRATAPQTTASPLGTAQNPILVSPTVVNNADGNALRQTTANVKKFDTEIENAKETVAVLTARLALLRKEQAKYRKELDTENGLDNFKRLTKEINDLRPELNQANKDLRSIQKTFNNTDYNEGSIKALQARYSELSETLRRLTPGIDITKNEFSDLQKEAFDIQVEIKNFNRSISGSENLVGEYGVALRKVFSENGGIDILRNSFNRLTTQQKEQKEQIATLIAEYRILEKEGGEAFEKVRDELLLTQNALNKTEKELKDISQSFDFSIDQSKIRQAFSDAGVTDILQKQADELVKLQTQQRLEVRKLLQEYRKLEEEGGEAFEKVSRELVEAQKNLEATKRDVKEVKSALRAAGQEGKQAFQAIATGAAVAISTKVLDFANDLASSFKEVNKDIETTNKTIQDNFKLTGDELKKLNADVRGLSNTFEDIDSKELLQTINANQKAFEGLGATAESTTELVGKVLLASNNRAEAIDQLREYSVQLNQIGISAEEAAGTTVLFERLGVPLDKGVDSLKEFNLRIKEQSKATTKTLEKAFGADFTKTILSGINDGSISVIDALQQISNQLKSTEIDSQTAQTVIKDVFGSAAEDAGGRAFVESLADVDFNINNLIDTSDKYTARQLRLIEINKELAREQAGFATATENTRLQFDIFAVKTLANTYKALTLVSEGTKATFSFLRENKETIGLLAAAFLTLNGELIVASASNLGYAASLKIKDAAEKASTLSTSLLNKALKANPILAIVSLLLTFAAAFKAVYDRSETVRASVSGFFNVLKLLQPAVDGVVKILSGLGNVAVSIGKDVLGFVSTIRQFIQENVNAQKVISLLSEGFKQYFSVAKKVFGGIVGLYQSAIGNTIGFANATITAITNIKQSFNDFFGSLGKGFSGFSAFLKGDFVGGFKTINDAISNAGNVGSDYIKSIQDAFSSGKNSFNELGNDIVDGFKNVGNNVGDAFNEGFEQRIADENRSVEGAVNTVLNKSEVSGSKTATDVGNKIGTSLGKSVGDSAKKEIENALAGSVEVGSCEAIHFL